MSEKSVVERLREIEGRVETALRRASRSTDTATLVAVSKTFPAQDIEVVLAAGHRAFGENRVQEAQGKWPALKQRYAGVELHLIGPLQSNKAGEAVALFDVIHTVDRTRIAAALAGEIRRSGLVPRLFVQVNTGAEPQKAGVLPENADAFIAECRNTHGLVLEGLMCIPPADDPPSPHFALLGEIARRNGLTGLSMGMSGDFEAALHLGSTHIRVGSAIFGSRPSATPAAGQ